MSLPSRKGCTLTLALLSYLVACEGAPAHVDHDAMVARNYRLEIQNPPGDAIGLNFSQSVNLRVRYTDDRSRPIEGEVVSFTMSGDNGSTGGASISNQAAITDEFGIAQVVLVAGAQRLDFRVIASAPNSLSAEFFIQVSDQGFTSLEVTAAHDGPRPLELNNDIQLRLFQRDHLECGDIDIDNLPKSGYPPRSPDDFGDTATFPGVPADRPYTLVGWSSQSGGRPLTIGCVTLAKGSLRSGTTVHTKVVLTDRILELQAMDILTELDLSTTVTNLDSESYWNILACPLGRAQLLLDCLEDAQGADSLMDCRTNIASPLGNAMSLVRGVLDKNGCRGSLDQNNQTSLDAQLNAAMSGWPTSEELSTLLRAREQTLNPVHLRSQLRPQSSTSANHLWITAQVGNMVLNLIDSERPVVESKDVPLHLSAAYELELPEHGFTLSYAPIAKKAFDAIGIVPSGAFDSSELGNDLVGRLVIENSSGCAALEPFVCTALALPSNCADQCGTIPAPLNALLDDWLRSLTSTGLDFSIQGNGTTTDENADLRIDSFIATSDSAECKLQTRNAEHTLPCSIEGSVPPPSAVNKKF